MNAFPVTLNNFVRLQNGDVLISAQAGQVSLPLVSGQSVSLRCASERIVLPVFRIDAQQLSFQLYCHAMRTDATLALEQLLKYQNAVVEDVISSGFNLPEIKSPVLILCDDLGFPAIMCAVEALRKLPTSIALIICQLEHAFPFNHQPSQFIVPGIPSHVTGAIPLLEDWHIASRIASGLDLPACFDGDATTLASLWLQSQTSQVTLLAAGDASFIEKLTSLVKTKIAHRQLLLVTI